jgi:hypothetical protein
MMRKRRRRTTQPATRRAGSGLEAGARSERMRERAARSASTQVPTTRAGGSRSSEDDRGAGVSQASTSGKSSGGGVCMRGGGALGEALRVEAGGAAAAARKLGARVTGGRGEDFARLWHSGQLAPSSQSPGVWSVQ